MVFSTRDTVFALSLPTDEPAEVCVKLTVGKNGKVKEKETRVHANHIAGYVAPAFLAATKEFRIDKSLLSGMQGMFMTEPVSGELLAVLFHHFSQIANRSIVYTSSGWSV